VVEFYYRGVAGSCPQGEYCVSANQA
jgi:hypothetical protein